MALLNRFVKDTLGFTYFITFNNNSKNLNRRGYRKNSTNRLSLFLSEEYGFLEKGEVIRYPRFVRFNIYFEKSLSTEYLLSLFTPYLIIESSLI
jgi:hypothetical protein